ncbi:hypothetical protein NDU88_002295 [Pleurodeles waltl]|uniref:Uncharacterized protein n=1 Tax=Pleurodeles waltl TaxID=8319 RepID=A0AAV7NF09_PLEWA|nr:hypothetical protein NDU88_002295 [Pleurodeles waltl]
MALGESSRGTELLQNRGQQPPEVENGSIEDVASGDDVAAQNGGCVASLKIWRCAPAAAGGRSIPEHRALWRWMLLGPWALRRQRLEMADAKDDGRGGRTNRALGPLSPPTLT